MTQKRIHKSRRHLRQTEFRKSKAPHRDSFVGRLERMQFPRRAFLQGMGVAAVWGLLLGGHYYYKKNILRKTWRPGKETWKPTIYAPSNEMNSIDKAIWLIQENICRYSIDDLKRMNLVPLHVYYIVTYQLRVKPLTDEHVRFYLSALDTGKDPFTNREGIYFPFALQGHQCQFLDTIFRAARKIPDLDSMKLGDSFLSALSQGGRMGIKVKGKATSLRQLLMDEIRAYPPERMGVTNSDPSWIISAYAGANRKPRDLNFFDEKLVLRYLPYAFELNPSTGSPRYFDFACSGTHFPDALSRLYWYYGQYDIDAAKTTQDTILTFMRNITPVDHWLGKFRDELIPRMKKFRDEPSEETFRPFFKAVEYIVHTLETILEPDGYYRYNYSLEKLEGTVHTLAEAISLWYTPAFEPHRELIDRMENYRNDEYEALLKDLTYSQKQALDEFTKQMDRYTPMSDNGRFSVFLQARFLQGCNALMMWKEYKQEKAAKGVTSN